MKLLLLLLNLFVCVTIASSIDYYNNIQLRIFPTDPKKKEDSVFLILGDKIKINDLFFSLDIANLTLFPTNTHYINIMYVTFETEKKKTLINQLNENKKYVDSYSKVNLNDLNNATRIKLDEYNTNNTLLQKEIDTLPDEMNETIQLKIVSVGSMSSFNLPSGLFFQYRNPSSVTVIAANNYNEIYAKRRLINKDYYIEIFD